MTQRKRIRFWVEAGCAGVAWLLALITLVWRDWIEMLFHTDPDHGNGTVEWLVVAGFAALGITASVLALKDRGALRRRPVHN